MALCHKWDVKNDFVYVLQFFSLISDGLGSVRSAHLTNSFFILKALVVKNSVLHDFGFGKVSPAKQL